MPIDYKKYPGNWKEIRAKILKRANGSCELCPAEQGKLHWKTYSKVVLTIHHINFDIADNRDSNLIALCQRCHIKLDAGEKARKRKEKQLEQNSIRLP